MHDKILIVGNFNWYFYEEALGEGFSKHGVNVIKFKIPSFKIIDKFLKFKALNKLNVKLLDIIKSNTPDYIFFYRTNEILPSTLKRIKIVSPKTKILFYHNDNPFYGVRNKIKYWLYLKCLKLADLTYVYRPSNLIDARKYTKNKIKLFYPHYCTRLHLVNKLNLKDKIFDIVFIGHFEIDRGKYIDTLVKSKINVKVFGGAGWQSFSRKSNWPEEIVNQPVYGQKYQETIALSKIALCFLSKNNNDVYTRRIFEIPAAGTVVLSEYTFELSELFIEDKEILLFKNKSELVNKVCMLLNDNTKLNDLTKNAHNKIINSNHSEIDRAKQIINDIK